MSLLFQRDLSSKALGFSALLLEPCLKRAKSVSTRSGGRSKRRTFKSPDSFVSLSLNCSTKHISKSRMISSQETARTTLKTSNDRCHSALSATRKASLPFKRLIFCSRTSLLSTKFDACFRTMDWTCRAPGSSSGIRRIVFLRRILERSVVRGAAARMASNSAMTRAWSHFHDFNQLGSRERAGKHAHPRKQRDEVSPPPSARLELRPANPSSAPRSQTTRLFSHLRERSETTSRERLRELSRNAVVRSSHLSDRSLEPTTSLLARGPRGKCAGVQSLDGDRVRVDVDDRDFGREVSESCGAGFGGNGDEVGSGVLRKRVSKLCATGKGMRRTSMKILRSRA